MMKIGTAWLWLGVALPVWGQPLTDWPAPPPPKAPTAVSLELMRHGEVLVDEITQAQGGGAAAAQALFRATPQEIWDTLGSCAANFRFAQGLLECEVTEQSPQHAITRQTAKKFWLAPRLTYRFESRRQPYEWIQLRLLDGDLKEMKGNWRFDPLDDSGLVLVTHEIYVRTRMPAPRWLVRRTLQRDLVAMFACLRFVSGGSLDEEGVDSDQAECPEPPADK